MRVIRVRTVLSSTKLDVPELAPLVGHRVELIVRDDEDRDWPADWFANTAGAIVDPSFTRASQPEPEVRPALRS